MKKILLLFAVLGTNTCFFAQTDGNVGINTATPTATLHVLSKGNTATTQALKVDNVDGTNVLTINNDGTVSGTAAVNLTSGTVGTPKASGIFSSVAKQGGNVYLSPNGNGVAAFTTDVGDPAFYEVAHTVPFNAVLSALTFTVNTQLFTFLTAPLTVEVFVNGIGTGYFTNIFSNILVPQSNFTSAPVSNTITVQRGDIIAYRLSNFPQLPVNCYVSMVYTEQ